MLTLCKTDAETLRYFARLPDATEENRGTYRFAKIYAGWVKPLQEESDEISILLMSSSEKVKP